MSRNKRAAPHRQGNPIPHTAEGQQPPPLQRENTKIVASGASGRGSAQAWLLDFCRRIIVVRSQQISAIGRYLNKRCAADSLRKRDKNSAMILRHDHNPAK
jgi:hypothetical protein